MMILEDECVWVCVRVRVFTLPTKKADIQFYFCMNFDGFFIWIFFTEYF